MRGCHRSCDSVRQGGTPPKIRAFDNRYDTVYENVALADVPDYDLVPRGGTALLDAIGSTIKTVKGQIKAMDPDERPGEVVLVILTDGAENSSREFTLERVKTLIEKRRAKGWQIVFLGADQDAITVAGGMGIGREASLAYASGLSRSSIRAAGRMVSRGSASGRFKFTDEERAAAQGQAAGGVAGGGEASA